MKRLKKRPAITLLLLAPLMAGLAFGAAADAQETISFGDFNWASAQMHNRVAGFIVEHGYGYEVTYQFGSTIPIFSAMARGDVDATTEMWPANIQAWPGAIEERKLVSLGRNYEDAPQGWYVPTYMIEGDPERGIEPITPGLHSVSDLPRYWKVFQDPEDPDQGRFYDAPVSWKAYSINQKKLEAYGLDEYYNSFPTGSEAALNASLMSAYKQGEPWVGYNWEPTWVLGTLDMTQLKEPAYTEQCWSNRDHWQEGDGCEFPPTKVLVVVNGDFYRNGPPEIIEFLDQYHTTLKSTGRALAYMHDSGADPQGAALWFLRHYEDMWTQWVPASVAQKVKTALEGAGA